MPIYEYECTKCGKVAEVIQKFSDRPLTKCEHCSGKVHKLISQSSFHLKGTGWYVTDYANKSNRPSISPKKEGSASTESAKKDSDISTKKSSKTTDKTS